MRTRAATIVMLSWRENTIRRQQERPPTRVYLAPRMLACCEDEALTRAFQAVGWAEAPSVAGASLVFNVCNPPVLKLQPGIIFSRFPAMQDCCRKALFASLLGRVRKLLPPTALLNDGQLIPRQWALPKQLAELTEHVNAASAAAAAAGLPRPTYIVKPDSGCQGQGIWVTADPLKQSPYAREAVIQQYIENVCLAPLPVPLRGQPTRCPSICFTHPPLVCPSMLVCLSQPMLLDGLKFDLRLYVLVTSVGGDADRGPMRAFLCREGMVRFAVEQFDGADLQNVHAHVRTRINMTHTRTTHAQTCLCLAAPARPSLSPRHHTKHSMCVCTSAQLTNYSLNKKAIGFVASDDPDGRGGSKRTVSSVFAALAASGQLADVEALWADIGRVVSRSLSVVQPVLASARHYWEGNPCFQVIGFDILLDSDARPWLVRPPAPASPALGSPAICPPEPLLPSLLTPSPSRVHSYDRLR